MSLGAFHLATNQDPVSTSNYQLGGGELERGPWHVTSGYCCFLLSISNLRRRDDFLGHLCQSGGQVVWIGHLKIASLLSGNIWIMEV